MTKELKDIENYSDVCRILGIRELTEASLHQIPMNQRRKLLAAHKIMNIAKLFNGDWKIDWSDMDQRKWYPYFDYKEGHCWCFLYSDCQYGCSYAQVAFFKDEQTSNHCGELFIEIYRDFLN